MTVEERLAEWEKQPGAKVSQAERNFIDDLRHYAAQGVGYGWMQQVIEWEWQAKDPTGAFGPEYFEKHRAEQVALGWTDIHKRTPPNFGIHIARDKDGQMTFANFSQEYGWEHVCDDDCGELVEWYPLPSPQPHGESSS